MSTPLFIIRHFANMLQNGIDCIILNKLGTFLRAKTLNVHSSNLFQLLLLMISCLTRINAHLPFLLFYIIRFHRIYLPTFKGKIYHNLSPFNQQNMIPRPKFNDAFNPFVSH